MKSTPWGASQSEEKIAEGITFYSTASHGGFKLSEERMDKLPEGLKDIKTWAGRTWYEEDCDYNIIVLAFPQFFEKRSVMYAIKYALSTDYNAEHFAKYFRSKIGHAQANHYAEMEEAIA